MVKTVFKNRPPNQKPNLVLPNHHTASIKQVVFFQIKKLRTHFGINHLNGQNSIEDHIAVGIPGKTGKPLQ